MAFTTGAFVSREFLPLPQGRLKVIEWRTRGHASKSEHPFDVVPQFLLTFVH